MQSGLHKAMSFPLPRFNKGQILSADWVNTVTDYLNHLSITGSGGIQVTKTLHGFRVSLAGFQSQIHKAQITDWSGSSGHANLYTLQGESWLIPEEPTEVQVKNLLGDDTWEEEDIVLLWHPGGVIYWIVKTGGTGVTFRKGKNTWALPTSGIEPTGLNNVDDSSETRPFYAYGTALPPDWDIVTVGTDDSPYDYLLWSAPVTKIVTLTSDLPPNGSSTLSGLGTIVDKLGLGAASGQKVYVEYMVHTAGQAPQWVMLSVGCA